MYTSLYFLFTFITIFQKEDGADESETSFRNIGFNSPQDLEFWNNDICEFTEPSFKSRTDESPFL